ncbi:hypothetical protein A3D85_00050 [Candidatus Amesbacteria bacterium RIFCSPHIGHO2_02_FULL_47_9]|uniref:Uncharacterized protein n=1 Tax=Candidatus Amesbacteria bacterium RIFCSPHIGHO2_01_FULL_48_32b TaxID=1797253 RepID=A0A1F4YGG7_9BACT|nr:MAG: hypothetical protein A2876_00870 [Candidatus Amesbacteria bacterium RIFCSPHIGHO2_01_FULL_48_32b]OGD03179.1 MAG: hypothetical protein A3D85_00050 [Candidatus Amesbacteria bacterium RIFCSPHIGHO2_02_FULL_47_9]OGD07431.1 MAG: hypothetical protein A2899_03965 [Candidatus Amesbacteria bacterium RIFCSPLOWO2_01_FULL_49_25]
MTHRHYISNRRWTTLIIGTGFWVILTIFVLNTPPDKWWVEVIANSLLFLGMIFVASWAWGTRKWGIVTAVGLWSLVIMRRLDILDWITFGLWLAILGLISLFN